MPPSPVAGSTLREPRAVRTARAVHINLLLLANRALDAVEAICQSEGITHQQYVVLWTLCLGEDPAAGVPIGAVTDGLMTRSSDATRLVDRLARAGLVERLAHPDDRRSVLVRATTEGQRVFAATTPKVQEFHRRQWSHLSASEIDALNALLATALWGATALHGEGE